MSAARVMVATGTRAEFGLLTPVMRAIGAHDGLELLVAAAGAHLLAPARTIEEVRRGFRVDAEVPMQRDGETGRVADARALGRGVTGFADAIERLAPDWVVVLGDRVEAFAAASAASVGGVPVAHLHGGDRAEGVADEAMRHAITKLAHLHLPATRASAERIARMGEPAWRIAVVGSPAIDGLDRVEPLGDGAFEAVGSPEAVLLMHPVGRDDAAERRAAAGVLDGLAGRRVLALHPNHDPGRAGVLAAVDAAGVRSEAHVERPVFLSLLKRLAASGGLLVGNSSAGLIEAPALGLPTVDVGDRQGGRERPASVVHAAEDAGSVRDAVEAAMGVDRSSIEHPYGDGAAGRRAAAAIAAGSRTFGRDRLLRKRNAD